MDELEDLQLKQADEFRDRAEKKIELGSQYSSEFTEHSYSAWVSTDGEAYENEVKDIKVDRRKTIRMELPIASSDQDKTSPPLNSLLNRDKEGNLSDNEDEKRRTGSIVIENEAIDGISESNRSKQKRERPLSAVSKVDQMFEKLRQTGTSFKKGMKDGDGAYQHEIED